MVERKCENCDYYDPNVKTIGIGRCRRYARKPAKNNIFDWPLVAEEDWCGEFAPKGTYNKMLRALENLERGFDEDLAVHFDSEV